ncbi:transmembrane and coiled-coil domains protein 2-like isoform X2 [Xenia sp. Carnegie-2017]|nr:transmembrane and coiled-coil domains protein 2-like isoform X2 [Xenia sp. Carnegie-2017]
MDEWKSGNRLKKMSADASGTKTDSAIQRNRSHSFDNILSRNKNSSNGKENLSFPHVALLGDTDGKLHSSHLSHTSEESAEELAVDHLDVVDGVDNTQRLVEEREKLRQKIAKTQRKIMKLQNTKDENVEVYLESANVELTKKAFEKQNLKSNADIAHFQKKLEKYSKNLKDLDSREQRTKNHSAKEMLRGVKTSVKEISGGVRDGVKGISGAVSKLYKSNENITDVATTSKSDSECQDLDRNGVDTSGYDVRKNQTPSPKHLVSEEDNTSIFSTQISVAPSSPGYSESSVDNIFEAKLKDVMDSHASLKETVDKAVVNINAIATSLQEERYKMQELEIQFNTLLGHWNDFSELHQREIGQLRDELQRNDESIATVDYRLMERVAEIDELFDTYEARMLKIENIHQQQQGVNVDGYFEQNTRAKAVLTKFLNVVLYVITFLFSISTSIFGSVSSLTKTRKRLILTAILIAFFAFWWHSSSLYLMKYTRETFLLPIFEWLSGLSKKLILPTEQCGHVK